MQLETSDIPDLTESYLKSALPSSKPAHSSSLSNNGGGPRFGAPSITTSSAPAPTFGGAFGRPRPSPSPKTTLSSASQIPLPASEPGTPARSDSQNADDGDSKDSIKRAFDAFGPRVGGGGGGFARPRPVGKR
jgi:twinfilin-like protein